MIFTSNIEKEIFDIYFRVKIEKAGRFDMTSHTKSTRTYPEIARNRINQF